MFMSDVLQLYSPRRNQPLFWNLITERHPVLIEKTFIIIVQGDLQLQQEFSLIIKKLIEARMIYCYDSTYHSGLSILS